MKMTALELREQIASELKNNPAINAIVILTDNENEVQTLLYGTPKEFIDMIYSVRETDQVFKDVLKYLE